MSENTFSSGRPIATLAEDQLGRRSFAESIAKVVSQWTGRDSLVAAVYGPWGSGKSSLKNMILDALSKRNAKTLTLEFNPWEWAGQEKLFEGFFRELSARLGSADASKNASRTAKKMRMYAAMLSAAASLTDGFRVALIALLAIAGLFGIAPALVSSGRFRDALAILGVLAILAASVLALTGKTADKIAAYFAAKAEVARRGVADLKKELYALLGALEMNVLVIVDDVDRLAPEQIRMMFQLVKANADFPNVVYLLLFQRDIIESALSRELSVDGAAFLRKVVQVGFDVPKITTKQLHDEIQSTVVKILKETAANAHFASDSKRWNKLFPILTHYFGTLRDVKSFGNGLSFHLELYSSADTFDASPVDVIALEVLRQFEPSLYGKLYRAKRLLTPPAGLSFESPAENKKDVEVLFQSARVFDSARAVLEDIFPPVAWALAELKERERGSQADWLRDLRPCHADIFDRYFRFGLSDEDLPTSDLDSVLNAARDRKMLVDKLSELSERNLLGAAVVLLRAHSELVPAESTASFATGMMDMERELIIQPQQPGGPTEVQAVWLIESVLRRYPINERGRIMREVICKTSALFLPLLSFESSEEERKKATDPLLSDQDAESLKESCLQKIRESALTAKLLVHPRLRHVLSYWLRWGSVEEAPGWVQSISVPDAGLLALLAAFTESMSEIDENGVKISTRYRFALEDFSKLVAPDGLAERIRKLVHSTSGDHQSVWRLFIYA